MFDYSRKLNLLRGPASFPSTPAAPIGNPMAGAIPGFDNLSSSAAGNIGKQLTGLPATSRARQANAYFGVGSGMPNSDFVRNRGFDLYGQQADQYQQQGLDNFLKLISGYSGTVAPTVGQAIGADEFNRNLEFQRQQAAADQSIKDRQLALEEPQYLGSRDASYHKGMGSFGKSTSEVFRDPRTGKSFAKTRFF